MKKKFIIPILLCNASLFAQFTIDGQFENYSNKKVLVKLYENSELKLIQNTTTDNTGKFTAKVPKAYNGFVKIDLPTGESLALLTDNKPIKFKTVSGQEFQNQLQIIEGKTHQEFQNNDLKKTLADVNQNVFPYLKNIYKPGDKFYQAILMEEQRIKSVLLEGSTTANSLVKYNLELQQLISDSQSAKNPEAQKQILDHLVNDDERLEQSGQMQNLVYNFLNFELNNSANATGSMDDKLKAITERLLNATDLQTSRGQAVLGTLLNLVPADQFKEYHTFYINKVEGLTCTITDALSNKVKVSKGITVGTVVPNIVFDQAVKGKKSLYDIKANQKLIVFWASWCPACNNEMPYIKEFYTNFKKQGGEIVAISLDVDQNAFQTATAGLTWYNYTDLLKWDSPAVEKFGVQSTPTLFLVDKDNKLIKKVNHISELITEHK